MATPMNLADTSNTPTSSPDLMSNRTFLNLVKKKRTKPHLGYGKVGTTITRRFPFKYFNNAINKSDRRNVSINPGSLGGRVK